MDLPSPANRPIIKIGMEVSITAQFSKFAYYGSNVAPSIYLKSSVLMKGGSGTSSDPYILKAGL